MSAAIDAIAVVVLPGISSAAAGVAIAYIRKVRQETPHRIDQIAAELNRRVKRHDKLHKIQDAKLADALERIARNEGRLDSLAQLAKLAPDRRNGGAE